MNLLTVEEVSTRLGISKNAVYQLCSRDGAAIRHLRLGKAGTTIRIPVEALEEYLDGATVTPSPKEVAKPGRGVNDAPMMFIREKR